jgi:hypothetical protein
MQTQPDSLLMTHILTLIILLTMGHVLRRGQQLPTKCVNNSHDRCKPLPAIMMHLTLIIPTLMIAVSWWYVTTLLITPDSQSEIQNKLRDNTDPTLATIASTRSHHRMVQGPSQTPQKSRRSRHTERSITTGKKRRSTQPKPPQPASEPRTPV